MTSTTVRDSKWYLQYADVPFTPDKRLNRLATVVQNTPFKSRARCRAMSELEPYIYKFGSLTVLKFQGKITSGSSLSSNQSNMDDLFQAAVEGILSSINRWQEDKSNFSSWMFGQARYAVMSYLSNSGASARFPRNLRPDISAIMRGDKTIEEVLDRPINPQGHKRGRHIIEAALAAAVRPDSLDRRMTTQPFSGSKENCTLGDLVLADATTDEYPCIETDLDVVKEAVRSAPLDARERFVVETYYGIGTQAMLTDRKVAPILDLSAQTINNVRHSALGKIRQEVKERYGLTSRE